MRNCARKLPPIALLRTESGYFRELMAIRIWVEGDGDEKLWKKGAQILTYFSAGLFPWRGH